MLRSRKPSKQGSYIKFTKRNVLWYWIEERSELLWGELSGNVPKCLILLLKRTQSIYLKVSCPSIQNTISPLFRVKINLIVDIS